MDWNLCVICQTDTDEQLKCPLNAKGLSNSSQPYKSFLENVNGFRKMDSLPVPLVFGDDLTVDDLLTNRGSWHKSCHLKFAAQKLKRITKKRGSSEKQASSEKRPRQPLHKDTCLFCQKEEGHLHEFATLTADNNVRTMAVALQDMALLARIGSVDLIALDAKYHLSCLTDLRNRYRSFVRRSQDSYVSNEEEKKLQARAFAELITYIENNIEDSTFFFKFSELRHLFECRLQDLGIQKEINKVRFKQQVLEHFPEAQEQSDGKNAILAFQQGMQQLLKDALKGDYEGDALVLAKAARIVRKDIFDHGGFHFDGSFGANCQAESTPINLRSLVSMVLIGANLKDQEAVDSQACHTISQLIFFNSKKRSSAATTSRHSLDHEPPLPLYIGSNIHTETRSKKLVTKFYDLGLSVSYDRVLQVESQLTTAVCNDFEHKGAVVPSQLRHGLFTVGALDNIDYNPSSTTAKDSFHGTAISLFQSPTKNNIGRNQNEISLASSTQKNHKLPDEYTAIQSVAFTKKSVSVPEVPHSIQTTEGHLHNAQIKEKQWVEHAIHLLEKQELDKGDTVAWSAFHASLQSSYNQKERALTQLLPIFSEKAATVAMIKHGMNMLRRSTEFLNPGQIPVIAMDAPLFALGKFVQWNWPATHGEDKYTIMFGGLHIEMAMWKTFGDYLDGSGWTTALTNAGVASAGTADSFLKASHLTRTRHGHQISALALAKLQEDAFMQTAGPHDDEARMTWRHDMLTKSPTFQYWDTILNIEIMGLIFVRSHREENFPLYVEVLKAIVPWFFALDHQNYARWIPIHIRDMESLPPSIRTVFEEHGYWTVKKTLNRFSSMPIDQAHEQNNMLVKGSGGAVGLTQNPSAFRKWMIAGPEQARLLNEFESEYCCSADEEMLHHEEGVATQKSFQEEALALTQSICDMGNPFLDDGSELLALDTRNIKDDDVVRTVRSIEALGKQQYNDFHKAVIIDRSKSIHEPIKKNSLALFKSPSRKKSSKQSARMSMLKDDVALFSRLYIVMQHREGDMSKFFKHENHPYPPSISEGGELYLPRNKSDLLKKLALKDQKDPPTTFDVKVLDGAAVVHQLSTANVSTFDEYADNVFLPYLVRQLDNSDRVDVVWDTYITNSIKESTRTKRGTGIRRKVEGRNKVPGNWKNFLRDSSNKQELFAFISSKVSNMNCPSGKEIYITSGASVVGAGINHEMPDCDHEEADTRLLIHIQDALENGSTSCQVRSVDTDVIVILIGKLQHLLTLNPAADIWVAFGAGDQFRFFHVNGIFTYLGKDRSLALPVFHSFTGCDTTSGFFEKGKKSAWDAWNCYPDVTQAFTYMAVHPFAPVDEVSSHFRRLERYVIVLYDKSSNLESINEARRELFCQKNKTMEHLPPTQDALLQHTKRALYQAGIWTTSELAKQSTPSPENWGWTLEDQSWTPIWITLPVSSKACSELVKCNCKSVIGCSRGRCGCKKANWRCTELCGCNCTVE